MNIQKLIIWPGIISILIAYLSTPFVIKFAWKFGLIDDPQKNKHPKVIHTKPTPRGGGLAIFISIFISSLIFLHFDVRLFAILLGAIIILIIGLLDDKFNLSPYLRLVIQFVAAAIPVMAGIFLFFFFNTSGVIL